MRDIRTIRSANGRALPSTEGDILLQLYRLAAEKHRLEREAEVWQRKREQIERRLGEIEQQMEHMHRSRVTVETPRKPQVESRRQTWKQVTLEY